MEYSLKIQDLVNRPIIRNDLAEEFMNKMTDAELKVMESEISDILKSDGVEEKFPDWNSAYLSKIVDRGIFYRLIQMGSYHG